LPFSLSTPAIGELSRKRADPCDSAHMSRINVSLCPASVCGVDCRLEGGSVTHRTPYSNQNSASGDRGKAKIA
jgi:hypothetical protein